MRKALFAFAAAAAFVSAASAQTSVTLYGLVDLGVERTKLSPGSSTTRLSSGIQSGSRLGFKGNEDLGGGLSASFQLESGIDASTGAFAQGGLGFGRQAWVGLNGGFGSVKLGRQFVPLFIAIDKIDPFGTGLTGDGSGATAVFRGYGVRMNNTINYSTPAVGGFSGEVAYGFGEVAGSTSAGSQYGASGTYKGGPLTVVAAYNNQNQLAAGAPAGKGRTAMVGAGYDLKVVTLNAAYAANRDRDAAGANTGNSRDYLIGLSAPVGAASLIASYVHRDDRRLANADAKYWQFGATYALSKRTNLYSSYSVIKNQANGATGSGAAGVDISWLNVGIRHRF